MTRTRLILAAAASAALLAASGAARADGYPPFYGYSDYFGGPQIYFTPDETVHQVTKDVSVEHTFGTRTYYRGGPFWAYGYNLERPRYAPSRRAYRRQAARRHAARRMN